MRKALPDPLCGTDLGDGHSELFFSIERTSGTLAGRNFRAPKTPMSDGHGKGLRLESVKSAEFSLVVGAVTDQPPSRTSPNSAISSNSSLSFFTGRTASESSPWIRIFVQLTSPFRSDCRGTSNHWNVSGTHWSSVQRVNSSCTLVPSMAIIAGMTRGQKACYNEVEITSCAGRHTTLFLLYSYGLKLRRHNGLGECHRRLMRVNSR